MCLLGRICIEGDFAGRLSEVIPTSTWKTLYQSMLSSGAGETPKLQPSSEDEHALHRRGSSTQERAREMALGRMVRSETQGFLGQRLRNRRFSQKTYLLRSLTSFGWFCV